ncbi:MAG: glucosaminidase domain-containing protein [Bacteroidales bacterium]|jgi:LysM repeat protein|nr:glucosaminidase domain-containing protein [Bacteroidales bacterium]
MKKHTFLLLLLFVQIVLFGQQYTQDDVYDYIDSHKDLAIASMKEFQIPASVKLAQAIYATSAGLSPLTAQTHNHFGILCGSGFEGATYTEPITNTCYRKYPSATQSYADHSDFLKNRSRYNRLFALENSDYKGWCHGLQAAGYSANPKYAEQLIYIIDTYFLQVYDNVQGVTKPVAKKKEPVENKIGENQYVQDAPQAELLRKQEEQKRADELKKQEEQQRAVELKREEEERKKQEAIANARKEFEITWEEKKSKATQDFQKEINRQTIIFNSNLNAEYEKEKVAFEKSLLTSGTSKTAVKKDTISGIEVTINKKEKTVPKEVKSAQLVEKTQQEVAKEQPAPTNTPSVTTAVFKAKDFEYKPVYYSYSSRNVYENNKIKFVITQKGDTYSKIGRDTQLSEENLRAYNDVFDDHYQPVQGEVVYLQSKNTKSPIKEHVIKSGETMRYIAQKYAVTLKFLYKNNGYYEDTYAVGNTICISCKKK